MQWTITFYSDRVAREIRQLPKNLQAAFFRLVDTMKITGPNLGMPHTKAMGNGLFEMRLKAPEGIGRVFYCTIVDQHIVVLHSFIKKTQKTPKRELDKARQRMKEVKSQ